ncbi:MAG: arginine--tRNA ligase [Actinomycetota bacterium]|nr:arginine--tRNA ligase [Actinomycetota bacterium]
MSPGTIEEELSRQILAALKAAAPELGLEGLPDEIEITRPRVREHGDYATGVAMGLAGQARRSPREVAEAIVRHLPPSPLVERVEVAGPGFVNVHLSSRRLLDVLEEALRLGPSYCHVPDGGGERVLVEYVSANPTGPLHVGTGRNAAVGDSLARLLEAAGYRVDREYYVNDAGMQAELFAASIEARYLERFGRPGQVPEGGYHGAYVADLAAAIADEAGERLLELPERERREWLRSEGIRRMLDGVRATLERFGARIDTWFSESTLHARGEIEGAIEALRERGDVYESEGATWFRASAYGDVKDRVLVRASGEPTYFAADCAYVLDKFRRGYERLVYVWGADHHGTVKRLEGAVSAYGFDPGRVEFLLTQLVALYRGGEPVRMSKRTGEIATLNELIDEVGPDAARYTLLSRSVDTPLDFDIDLVTRQSMDNPVYYVQYAHARIASVLAFAAERGIRDHGFEDEAASALAHEAELDLLRRIGEVREQVRLAAARRAPNRLTRTAHELAAAFHRFYTECRVVTEDATLTRARLMLAGAAGHAIAGVLAILGVSAPTSMERLHEGEETS